MTMITGSPSSSSARTNSASVSSKRRSMPRTQYQATCTCSDSGILRVRLIIFCSSSMIFLSSTPISRPWVSTMPRLPTLSR